MSPEEGPTRLTPAPIKRLLVWGLFVGAGIALLAHTAPEPSPDHARVHAHSVLRGEANRLQLLHEEARRVMGHRERGEQTWPPTHVAPLDGPGVADEGFFVATGGELAMTWLRTRDGRGAYRVWGWRADRVRLRDALDASAPHSADSRRPLAWITASHERQLEGDVPVAMFCQREDGLVLLVAGSPRLDPRATGALSKSLSCQRASLMWSSPGAGTVLRTGSASDDARLVLTRRGPELAMR